MCVTFHFLDVVEVAPPEKEKPEMIVLDDTEMENVSFIKTSHILPLTLQTQNLVHG